MRLLPLLFMLGACGGAVSGASDAGDAGPTSCPAAEPNKYDPCGTEGLECEYGSSDRFVCNDVYVCKLGSWDSKYTTGSSCVTPNPPTCPMAESQVPVGSDCSNVGGTTCDYSTSELTVFCACVVAGGPPLLDGGNGGSYTWMCTSTPGCPKLKPTLGTSCAQPNLECDYAVCDAPSGASVQCDPKTQTWTEGLPSFCGGV